MAGTIRSKLRWLVLAKEEREGRKLPYRVLSEEVGVSPGALNRLANNESERADMATLSALCGYFNCGVGDLLEYVPVKEEAV